MNLSTSLVDIENLTSEVPRSNFSETELEKFARALLKSGGIVKPLLIKRTDIDSYVVVEGHFEYYATVKATEIDPDLEMVRAFIVSSENEQPLREQVELLNQKNSIIPDAKPTVTSENGDRITNLEIRLTKSESRLEERFKNLELEVHKYKRNQARTKPLDIFNKTKDSNLVLILRGASITGKTANSLIEAIQEERQKQEFKDLSDVVKRINGLGDTRLRKIIDSWSQITFEYEF